MKRSSSKYFVCRPVVLCILTGLVLLFSSSQLYAKKVLAHLPVDSSSIFRSNLTNLALHSDSVFCNGTLIPRTAYAIDYKSGVVSFNSVPECDTVLVVAFQLPGWLTSSIGNTVPEGKKSIITIEGITGIDNRTNRAQREVNLSGNKSFSFIVGRSGEGNFSQGLNLEVDASLADNLRLRGAVSDRIGAGGNSVIQTGPGNTTTISELDKYYFELIGRKVSARAGDITSLSRMYLPEKRIKGVNTSFQDRNFSVEVDIGRPAGRYETYAFLGNDGKQGPYQVRTTDGLPSGIVAGSEKVYVDGRLVEGGSNRYYEIDYFAGRITFSPRMLVTALSRIEIDFEATDNDFEQQIVDISQSLSLFNNRFKLSAGMRRESDDKDRFRFSALSPADIEVISQAGDSPALANRTGITPDTNGAYIEILDSLGNTVYEHVGAGTGDYSVSFSFVGDGRGDYFYLGDSVYRYAGKGNGDYLPILFLPLPSRSDTYVASGEMRPYQNGLLSLSYLGNNTDHNLFSPQNDDDNLTSLFESEFRHQDSLFYSKSGVRFVQEGYTSLNRINRIDSDRLWAFPAVLAEKDETRFETDNIYQTSANRLQIDYGYLSYKNYLSSHRFGVKTRLLQDRRVSPSLQYESGNSKSLTTTGKRGNYEHQLVGVSIKTVRRIIVETGYEKEFRKDTYGAVPMFESFTAMNGNILYRNTVLSLQRRTDFSSDSLGRKGPRIDKVQVTSEESVGCLRAIISATVLNQAGLDSERSDRDERLFETTFRYNGARGWLTLQANYRQNRQTGSVIGFRYIFVGIGQGEYRLEDGLYLYDEDGDYVRIREERGEAQSLIAGSKSHNIFLYPGRLALPEKLKTVLSQIALRLRTEVIEELPGEDKKKISWLLPWQSTSGLSYTNRIMREQYRILLFPSFNFYRVNLLYSHAGEEQEAGAILRRSAKEYKVEVKGDIGGQARSVVDFSHKRKTESGIGLAAIRIARNTFGVSVIVNKIYMQVTPRLEYQSFSDQISNGKGTGFLFKTNLTFRKTGRGEVRLNVEFRSLQEDLAFTQPEYLVTDGQRFGKSAFLSLVSNYELTKILRITVNLSDRIFENRPAEFIGRGEIIARF